MIPSFIVLNRFLEDDFAQNEAHRIEHRQTGRPILADGRALSDEALQKKLKSLGITINREELDRLSIGFPSAQDLSEDLIARHGDTIPMAKEDWVWVAIESLWEKWFPDRPNCEMIDDAMQAGYSLLAQNDTVAAARKWSSTWHSIKLLMRRFEIPTIEEFDSLFRGTNSVFNWVQDFLNELRSTRSSDPSQLNLQIEVYRSVLAFTPDTDRYASLVSRFKDALATCLDELGEDADSQAESEQRRPEQPLDDDLDHIIQLLDQPYNGILPESAMRLAQQHREQITPRLIDLIVSATQKVRHGEELNSSGPLLAIYLLSEFRASEVLPAVIEAISLPGEGPFDVFGDFIIGELANFLAFFADDRVIEKLICNRSINEYVTWASVETYSFRVRDQKIGRKRAIERLRLFLASAISDNNFALVSQIVSELYQLAPLPALDEVNEAFDNDLVDGMMMTRDEYDRDLESRDRNFDRYIAKLPSRLVDDAVNELKTSIDYTQESMLTGLPEVSNFPTEAIKTNMDVASTDEFPITRNSTAGYSVTVRNTQTSVGRNDPCPCGSQKKYKKCCLRR